MLIRTSPENAQELKILLQVGVGPVRQFLHKVQESPVTLLQAEQLESLAQDALAERSERERTILLRQLLSLARLRRHRQLSAEQLIQAVTNGLADVQSWDEDDLRLWQEDFAPILRDILEYPGVVRVAKALDLAYEYANLMQDARIMTDVRPVFDAQANDFEGTVISQTLRIHYDNSEGNHSISIALDDKDIRELKQQCERALSKARVAKENLMQAGYPSYIAGEVPEGDKGS